MSRTKNILKHMMHLSLLASLGIVALLSLAQTDAALAAAVAPNLESESAYGVVSSTFTNANTAPQTIINGDVCCTTCTLPLPLTITGGPPEQPCDPLTKGPDQIASLGILNGQPCTPITPGVPLNAVDIGGGPGVFTPGCYSSTAAMLITVGTTVTLNGPGVYVFRPGGALTTGANSIVALANGACENDVFWAPTATNLGATSTFVGNILDTSTITIGHFANLAGRALSFGHTVITDANTITVPTCVSAPPPPPPPIAPLLGKAFNPVAINEGCGASDKSTLTITLSNPNATAATITSLTDNLPSGMTIANPTNAGTSCPLSAVNATIGGSTVTLTGGSIPAGTPGTCTVQVDVCAATAGPSGTSYVNTLLVGALKTSNGNNLTQVLATLIVNNPNSGFQPPAIGKVFDPVSITAGHTSTLTFTLTNPSTDTADTGVTFTDTLPSGMVIATPPDVTNGCNGSVSATAGGNTVTLTGGSIAAASACTVTVKVTVTALSGGSFINRINAGDLVASEGVSVLPAVATLTVVPVPAMALPTLSEWGMIIFMLLVGLMSIYYLRRQKAKA
jgi:uncharacterized repeat protein (TIGR01451 family)